MAEKHQDNAPVERIRGKVVVRHLTPGEHASVVALVEGGAVIRVARPDDASQVTWAPRATALRGATHPSLVRMLGANGPDTATRSPAFVASEFIDGPLLAETAAILTGEEAVSITRALAEAVQVMHAANTPHGRIHAGQVRLRADQTPVLLDAAATWGTTDATTQDDVEALIELALSLPAGPDRAVWERLSGTGASITDIVTALDTEPWTAPADEAEAPYLAFVAPAVSYPVYDEVPDESDAELVNAPALPFAPAVEADVVTPAPASSSLFAPSTDVYDDEEDDAPASASDVEDDATQPAQDISDEVVTSTYAPVEADVVEPEALALPVAVPAETPFEAPVAELVTYAVTPEPLEDEPFEDEAAFEARAFDPDTAVHFTAPVSTPTVAPEAPAPVPAWESVAASPEPIPTLPANLYIDSDNLVGAPLEQDELAAQQNSLTPAPRSEVPVVAIVERPAFDESLVVTPSDTESVADVTRELADAVAARDALARQVASSVNREQRLRNDLMMARAEADAAAERAHEATGSRRTLEDELHATRDALAAADAAAAGAEARASELHDQITGAEVNAVHLAAAEAAADEYDVQLATLTRQVADLHDRAANAEADVQVKDAQIAALNHELTTRTREVVDLSAQVRALNENATSGGMTPVDVAAQDVLAVRADTAEAKARALALQVAAVAGELADARTQLAEAAATGNPDQERVVMAEATAQLARQNEAAARTESAALRNLTTSLSMRLAGFAPAGAEDPRVEVLTHENATLRTEIATLRTAVPGPVPAPVTGDAGAHQQIERLIADKMALSRQVSDLRTALTEAGSAYERAMADANEARNALLAHSGSILPVTAEPATPVVAVVDPQSGPAGPGLVAALRDAETARSRAYLDEAGRSPYA